MSEFTLHLGDCIERMRAMPDNSVDAIVTDPPYHLTTGKKGGSGPASYNPDTPYGAVKIGTGFMGMTWDGGDIAQSVELWTEALRVLKPGGHLLAFSGSRTYHRMAVAIEDAGFEIRDQIMWLYGSGFPKNMDVSKAIDKAAGAERERIPGPKTGGMASLNAGNAQHGYRDEAYYEDGNMMLSPEPATDAAREWQGWGTALKPAHEPICMARKPLIGTVAANVLAHGTGALNIEACRVPFASEADEGESKNKNAHADFGSGPRENAVFGQDSRPRGANGNYDPPGRWPANLIHDGSDEVLAAFPATNSVGHAPAFDGGKGNLFKAGNGTGGLGERTNMTERHFDAGSAARFFYAAKASKKDRNEGCEDNFHPTVKPTSLMRYLVRLVTPPGGIVLDPFMGSGSTGKAAMLEGFGFVGIELTADYLPIAEARIAHAQRSAAEFLAQPQAQTLQPDLFEETPC